MYHAACKVEFQPFKRLYSQLTFFNFLPRSLQSWVSTIHTVVLTADVFQLFIKTFYKKPLRRLKGHWLPVLLQDEDGCTKLLIRCADAVAWCQGVEINCLVLVLMSRSWGADSYWDDVRVLPARLEFTTCCETTRETSRPYSLEFNTDT